MPRTSVPPPSVRATPELSTYPPVGLVVRLVIISKIQVKGIKVLHLRCRAPNAYVVSTGSTIAAAIPAREEVIMIVEFENGATFHSTIVFSTLSQRNDVTIIKREAIGWIDTATGNMEKKK